MRVRSADERAERDHEPGIAERVYSSLLRGFYSLGLPAAYQASLPPNLRPRPGGQVPLPGRPVRPRTPPTSPDPTRPNAGETFASSRELYRWLESLDDDPMEDDDEEWDPENYWGGVDEQTRYEHQLMVERVRAEREKRDIQDALDERNRPVPPSWRVWKGPTPGGGPRRGHSTSSPDRSPLGNLIQGLVGPLPMPDVKPPPVQAPPTTTPRSQPVTPRGLPVLAGAMGYIWYELLIKPWLEGGDEFRRSQLPEYSRGPSTRGGGKVKKPPVTTVPVGDEFEFYPERTFPERRVVPQSPPIPVADPLPGLFEVPSEVPYEIVDPTTTPVGDPFSRPFPAPKPTTAPTPGPGPSPRPATRPTSVPSPFESPFDFPFSRPAGPQFRTPRLRVPRTIDDLTRFQQPELRLTPQPFAPPNNADPCQAQKQRERERRKRKRGKCKKWKRTKCRRCADKKTRRRSSKLISNASKMLGL